ncbi:probable G-protein coupled receptor B0563.6 [Pomacea canaliculata]|uniref:probable G-protein coupled receptor B0563.6 n=1 Tax=Pomacea canaliculata TaxID=400727 RepID=UPI000D734A1A|nr:probable G-protein coupled receptor B0563.6 [Pomacea canaliculata]XP_025086253.1 probable G-protein coupled receptor B0563.6 [Pomacea canaliculata]
MPSIFNVSQFDQPYDFLHSSTNRSDYDKSVDILTTTAASFSPFFAENTFPSALDNDTALVNFSVGKLQEGRNLTSLLSNPTNLPVPTISKYAVPVVCVMGVVLNCLNLRVLSERCLKESPYTYLSAMAVLCLLNLVMIFIHNIFTNFLLIIRFNLSWLVFQIYIYYPTINICANSIMWLTTTLTIERFLFVCYPLWARATCDRRAAKMKVCIIVALLTLLNIPRFFLYRLVLLKPNKYAPTNTTFRLSKAYIVISWINSALIQVTHTLIQVTHTIEAIRRQTLGGISYLNPNLWRGTGLGRETVYSRPRGVNNNNTFGQLILQLC